ncbi:hypothetical protein T310_9162, partial [Rasamsonia emersonii CBS 393.64]
ILANLYTAQYSTYHIPHGSRCPHKTRRKFPWYKLPPASAVHVTIHDLFSLAATAVPAQPWLKKAPKHLPPSRTAWPPPNHRLRPVGKLPTLPVVSTRSATATPVHRCWPLKTSSSLRRACRYLSTRPTMPITVARPHHCRRPLSTYLSTHPAEHRRRNPPPGGDPLGRGAARIVRQSVMSIHNSYVLNQHPSKHRS